MCYIQNKLIQVAVVVIGTIGVTSAVCHGGYTANNGNCYRFYDTAQTWDNARKTCQLEHGGDLARIDTTQEATNVRALRTTLGNTDKYFWIGAQQMPFAISDFRWINRHSFNTQLWYPGEPNQVDNVNKMCIDLGTTAQQMKMNDYPCSAALPFMCEKKCGVNWVDGQSDNCYLFLGPEKTWEESRTECQELGGYLAVIDTPAEAENIALLKQNLGHGGDYYWIGARQEPNASGDFKWILHSLTGNIYWQTGEPNQRDNVNRQCVDIGPDGKMFDWNCDRPLKFLCEKRQ